jgi:acetyl esterase/lipase
LLVFIHGGYWRSLDKHQFSQLALPYLAQDINVALINYRLAPQYKYPACVEDAEAAVKWLKAHAKEYHVDPQKIVLIGESAGGHIVDMVAVRATKDNLDTRVFAVVAFYAPCDNVADSIRRGGPSLSMQNLLGVPAGPMDDKTTKALFDISPLNFVHKDLPPYLLVHGTADKSVPYEQSIQWQARLKALGVPCELITVKDGPHVMGRWETIDPTYKEKTMAWLVKTLGLKSITPSSSPGQSGNGP